MEIINIPFICGWISDSASTIIAHDGGCAVAYPPYHIDINGISAISTSLNIILPPSSPI